MALTKSPGWYVISLRPRGGHESLRQAAAAQGARLIALSPWRLEARLDAEAREALRQAIGAPRVLFTSPAAVLAAAGLLSLQRRDAGQAWIAVGAGTARSLGEAGIDAVQAPARMDAEGLLAMDALQQVQGMQVGLVTAPDGREVLAPALRQRGAEVLRADVYTRVPVAPSALALRRLRALDRPAALVLSSGGALDQLLSVLPEDLQPRLRVLPVVAASARLRELARARGFADVVLAEGPLPVQLLAAISHRFR